MKKTIVGLFFFSIILLIAVLVLDDTEKTPEQSAQASEPVSQGEDTTDVIYNEYKTDDAVLFVTPVFILSKETVRHLIDNLCNHKDAAAWYNKTVFIVNKNEDIANKVSDLKAACANEISYFPTESVKGIMPYAELVKNIGFGVYK